MMLIPKNEFAELSPVRHKAPFAVDRLETQTLHPAMRLMEGHQAMRLDPLVWSSQDAAAKSPDQSDELIRVQPANQRPRNGKPVALIHETTCRDRETVYRCDVGKRLAEKRVKVCPVPEPAPHPLFRRVLADRLEIAR
jgi:hypothetical protein